MPISLFGRRDGAAACLMLGLFGGLLLGLPLGSAAADSSLPPLAVGMTPVEPYPAKPLLLKDLDGELVDLKDLIGAGKSRWVLVNFWATWCPPCVREMPSLQRLHQRFADRGLTVVAVDMAEDEETVFAFLGQLEPSPEFPLLLDPDGSVTESWGVRGLPTSFLLDVNGRVFARAIGGRDFADPAFVQQLEQLLDSASAGKQ